MEIVKETTYTEGSCSECGNELVRDVRNGQLICQECGLVGDDTVIDHSYNQTYYTKKEANKKRQTGKPIGPLNVDIALNTKINTYNVYDPDLKRVLNYDSHVSKNRTLLNGVNNIKRIANVLNIPYYIQSDAFLLFKKLKAKNLIWGRSISSLSSACLYYYCRLYNYPIFLFEIEELIEKNNILRDLSYICKELTIKYPLSNPKRYIPKICNWFGLDQYHENRIREALDTLPKYPGKNPIVILASLFYILTQDISQKEIANTLHITSAGFRPHINIIKDDLPQ